MKRNDNQTNIYKAAWDMAYDGMIVANAKGMITFCNAAVCVLFGYTHEELHNKPLELLIPSPHKEKPSQQAEAAGDGLAYLEGIGKSVSGKHKEGFFIPLEISLSAITDNRETYTIVVIRDITERKESEKKLQQFAYYDQLTGLANRSYFYKKLKENFDHAKRYGDSFAILYLDLDNFKSVNEHYGHKYGDDVLVKATKRITAQLRTTDLPARLGGDEFIILLTDTKDTNNCELVAKRIIEEVKRPMKIESETITVGVSIGIAMYDREVNTADLMIKNADKAMYVAKSVGPNQYMFYEPPFAILSSTHD